MAANHEQIRVTTYINQMEGNHSRLYNKLVKKAPDIMVFIRGCMEVKISAERFEIPVIRPELVEKCKAGLHVDGYVVNMQRNDPSDLPSQPENEENEVPVLSVTRLKDSYKGTHESLSVFEYSSEGKIIVKKILKTDKSCITEIIANVKLQKTGISPAIYLIVESYTTYDVYMEMIYPGITLAEVTDILPYINPTKRSIFIYFIIYRFLYAMKIIWGEFRSHNDIHDRNVMLQASNQCLNIRIIDFGYAKTIKKVTNENITKDVIQVYNLISEFLKQIEAKDLGTLNEYKQTKEKYPSIEKIDELMIKVNEMAVEFGRDRDANKEICEMITKMGRDRVATQELCQMTKIGEDEEKRCSCIIY